MTFISNLDAAKSTKLRVELCNDQIQEIVTTLLELEEGEISNDDNLQDAGLDSLKIMKLKAILNELLEGRIEINPAELAGCYTVNQYSSTLVNLVYGDREQIKMEMRKDLIKLMKEDIPLPSHIQVLPGTLGPISADKISCVFATGVTGNMGPYFVQQLTQLPQISRVICLVRPGTGGETGSSRLFKKLKDYDLLSKTIWNKVEVVEGNLTTSNFGLAPSLYEKLSSEVEAIVHNGVFASHLEVYGRGASTTRGVRAVNIRGALHVLEFAVKSRVKSILNFSTVAALINMKTNELDDFKCIPSHYPTDEDAYLDEETPNFGYGISKLIADSLFGQAIARGVPCKSFRLPKVFGDTIHGSFSIVENHFVVKFLYFVKSGVMPNINVPLQVIPVDTSAKISIQLFFDPAVPSEMFNFLSPNDMNEPTAMTQLTKEYGPLLRVACHFWEVLEDMKKAGQDITEPKKGFQLFLEGLKERCKHEGIDLTPLIALIEKSVPITGDLVANPNLLFKNQKVREFILKEYAYDLELVEFPIFKKHLIQDGPLAFLHNWIDFYTREDSPYARGATIFRTFAKTLDIKQNKNWMTQFEKVRKYFPGYDTAVPSPVDTVRQSFEYTLDNATEIFKTLLHEHAKLAYSFLPDM